jgi:hypothetical protein
MSVTVAVFIEATVTDGCSRGAVETNGSAGVLFAANHGVGANSPIARVPTTRDENRDFSNVVSRTQ